MPLFKRLAKNIQKNQKIRLTNRFSNVIIAEHLKKDASVLE